MNEFLLGAVTTGCLLAGLFFLRFWRLSRDRLFLIFCLAFWILAINWTLHALGSPINEYLYVLRLLAFGLIALAIMDKNRRPRR
jgi:hypothetical protein